uniref:Cyclin-like domain-containing protein n=2 Tax=Lotharella globosa TaxID=91324 RepID=A0A7S3Y9E6_9EUKA|eukprot:CAMPEP_0167791908 /NCGR_PEP_ID=MMETSP0111_2-20121227/12235_1 /TAXON_ID=91324 /ORGANISM="Lotharella globosa, Strain CCCM811" /LENGTH=600 /DNA_ID=CAMNT_0007684705 /DNA_START=75 /DNA_END=1877 /DNA_ORIENTATION=+
MTDNVKGSWMECAVCGRVVEERQPKLKHTTFSFYRWSPFATIDTQPSEASSANEKPKEAPEGAVESETMKASPDDKPLDEGFITCFSQMNSELFSVDLAFSRSLSGDIIEMQKLVGDDIQRRLAEQDRKAEASSDHVMIGYVTIDDLCTTFGTPLKKLQAVQLFQRCTTSAVYEQVTNFEALAIAAYAVCTCKEYEDVALKINDTKSPEGVLEDGIGSGESSTQMPSSSVPQTVMRPTLTDINVDGDSGQEVASRSNRSEFPGFPSQGERGAGAVEVTWNLIMEEARTKSMKPITEEGVRKHVDIIKNIINNEPVVVEALRKSMSEFFGKLNLGKETASLAAHIGNQAVKKHLCYRRNSSSLSAASVYLACQLQGMRTTQNSFCKTVGLTEVTLRKVYKELKNHWATLVPENYTPFKVPNGLKSLDVRLKKEDDSRPKDSMDYKSTPEPSPRNANIAPQPSHRNSEPASPAPRSVPPTADSGMRLGAESSDRIADLQSFPIPTQYTREGKLLWADGSDHKAARSRSSSAVPDVLLKPYPIPREVYADIPSDTMGRIIVKSEPGLEDNKKQNWQHTPRPAAGTTRKLVRVCRIDSKGNPTF